MHRYEAGYVLCSYSMCLSQMLSFTAVCLSHEWPWNLLPSPWPEIQLIIPLVCLKLKVSVYRDLIHHSLTSISPFYKSLKFLMEKWLKKSYSESDFNSALFRALSVFLCSQHLHCGAPLLKLVSDITQDYKNSPIIPTFSYLKHRLSVETVPHLHRKKEQLKITKKEDFLVRKKWLLRKWTCYQQ